MSARTIPRRQRIDEIWRTPEEVIARIRTLATHQTDRQIAIQLNAEGLTTGTGRKFDRVCVRRVRLKYEIPASCPEMPTPGRTGSAAMDATQPKPLPDCSTSALAPSASGAVLANWKAYNLSPVAPAGSP